MRKCIHAIKITKNNLILNMSSSQSKIDVDIKYLLNKHNIK